MTAPVAIRAEDLRLRAAGPPAWFDEPGPRPAWPFTEIAGHERAHEVLDFLTEWRVPLNGTPADPRRGGTQLGKSSPPPLAVPLTGLRSFSGRELPTMYSLTRSLGARRIDTRSVVTHRFMHLGLCHLDAEQAHREGVETGSLAWMTCMQQFIGGQAQKTVPFWSYGRSLRTVLANRGALNLDPSTHQPQVGWIMPGRRQSVSEHDLHDRLRALYEHAPAQPAAQMSVTMRRRPSRPAP